MKENNNKTVNDGTNKKEHEFEKFQIKEVVIYRDKSTETTKQATVQSVLQNNNYRVLVNGRKLKRHAKFLSKLGGWVNQV